MPGALDRIRQAVQGERLEIFGAFHPDVGDAALTGIGTLVLLGPSEPGFWAHVTASPEFTEPEGAHRLDRWSARIIAALAVSLGATPFFPFGPPPYRPFFDWALRSGRAWKSPVNLLVHDRAGLMVSYRGALGFAERMPVPGHAPRPCDTCKGTPCRTACPVGALAGQAYDVAVCHGYLDSPDGAACMGAGCAARRACPVSQGYGRRPAQSAFHMKAFHP